MPRNRKLTARRTLVQAVCLDCGERWDSANAHGVAVQHHDRYGHTVAIDYEMAYVYWAKGGAADQAHFNLEAK